MYSSPSTVGEAIWGGFLVFGICSFFGLKFLVRGLRDDILDASGHPVAHRAWFIVGGVLMQLPLALFVVFAWSRGYFE
jgi:hypothetical protein